MTKVANLRVAIMVEDKIVPEMTAEVEKHFGFEANKPAFTSPTEAKGRDYSMPADAAHFAGKLGEI
jgi:hypothetical protein